MMRRAAIALVAALTLVGLCPGATPESRQRRPNVILIMTDDQGYGEIGAHGNPVIKTPHMDRLHAGSIRFTDFHVDPTCSPTRAALLTGRYSTRTGVWHTINGRSMINPDELTLAEVFKANGYRTAMIGKWHLGNNYPCRPEDQGFEHVIRHQGGGIGNGPDYWENDYFDDSFKANGKWQKYEGYCTDVWFREATQYVKRNRHHPFFLYLVTNAPHGPYFVDEKYARPYEAAGLPPTMAKFYGMITNIDENLGRLRARLQELGLTENTLLIFMTDNGTTAGWIDRDSGYTYYNAGMRGWKGSQWDGGHRVPCFFYWPGGGLQGGRDVDLLSAHIDILPTLVDLLDLKQPPGRAVDGVSLCSALVGKGKRIPARTLFAHVQRSFLPPKWTRSAAMTERWRLIDGQELYDIVADPGQQTNIAEARPDVVKRLRSDYEAWWASLQPALEQTVRYGVGGAENPTTLASHDWLMPGVKQAAWHQSHIRRGAPINGPWALEVEQAGTYEITLYRWAPYLNRAMGVKQARITLGNIDREAALALDATQAQFCVKLERGPAMLHTWLTRPDGKQHGAYYARLRYLGS